MRGISTHPSSTPKGINTPSSTPRASPSSSLGSTMGPQDNGLPPPNGGYPQGVVYDDRSSSFVVNGQQYGQYRPQ